MSPRGSSQEVALTVLSRAVALLCAGLGLVTFIGAAPWSSSVCLSNAIGLSAIGAAGLVLFPQVSAFGLAVLAGLAASVLVLSLRHGDTGAIVVAAGLLAGSGILGTVQVVNGLTLRRMRTALDVFAEIELAKQRQGYRPASVGSSR
jgi:hypothetical protein